MDRRCQILAWGKTREIYVAALVDLSYLTCTGVSHKGGASAAELRCIALRVYLRRSVCAAEVCVTSETFGNHPARQPQRLVTSGFSARMEKYKLPLSPKSPAGQKQVFIFLLLPSDSTTALWHVVIYQVISHTLLITPTIKIGPKLHNPDSALVSDRRVRKPSISCWRIKFAPAPLPYLGR